MPLTSIKLKPGINSVETPTLNEGGWSAASNIRFFEGLPQKDAGFVDLFDDSTIGDVYALKAWSSFSTTLNYLAAAGSLTLKVWDGTALTDITPTPIWADRVIYSLDNWGEFLMACPNMGPVYVWEPAVGGPAQDISTAPQENAFIFVAAQQQQLVCCGTVNSATENYDPMLLAWSDIGDYTDFTPSATNQAGSFRLPIGSLLQASIVIPGQNLLWTDIVLYSMQYIEFPLVWGFQPIAINCGAVGPHAVGILAGVPFWMGPNQFFVLSGEGAQQLECPVWDQVFPNAILLERAVCETDSYYGEVAWTVQQSTGVFIRVRLNVRSGAWTVDDYHHHLSWIDQNIFGPPIGGHEDGLVDQHDTGFDANGEPAPYSLTSGIIMISEGDETTFVRDVIPDFATRGTSPSISLTVSFYDYPNKSPRVHGPYTLTNSTQVVHPRGRGRGIQFTFSGDDLGTFMRLGNVRYRGQPDGKR